MRHAAEPLGTLGLAHATGRGAARDDRQAVGWFEQAASNGLPLAQYALGMLYSNGKGIERDWIKAHLWLNLAASGGYVGAAQPLDFAASQLNEKDLARAREMAREWRTVNATDIKPN